MRVCIVTASIGAGHDLPAERLAEALGRRGVQAQVLDGLRAAGPLAERLILGGSSFETVAGNRAYDAAYWLLQEFPPTRGLGGWMMGEFGRRGLLGAVGRSRPDVVVSTYPGATEALARARRSGRLPVPLASVITDLAALGLWAAPGVDLHLVTHPESIPEVRARAGAGTRVHAVRGFNPAGFANPPSRAAARARLGLPGGAPVVLASGGGWGIGDVLGAVEAARAVDGCHVLVLCGSSPGLRERVDARFADDALVRPLGFTDQMPVLMAAADVLIHSTAGLTVLEAAICGCHAISYGWGRGHLRANNRAYERFGLAHVAADRPALDAALARCLAERRPRDDAWLDLPEAADVLLGELAPAG